MARILVIEDNPANLELMTYLLNAFGHTVDCARDGESGIEAAQRERPDLILCDVLLPGVDGYAVARKVRGIRGLAGTPIVAVTALAMEGDRVKGLAAGFDGYIAKPIDPETFVAEADGYLRVEQRGAFPQERHAATTAPAESAQPVKATLVVVDDSPTNRDLIYQTLAPFGYRVQLAGSVQDGLQLLASTIPDMILSDLHMPGEDGFNFIRRVKADPQLAGIPFVFISSSIWGEGDREKAMELGVSRFLLRPIEPQALINEVVNCLRAAGKEAP